MKTKLIFIIFLVSLFYACESKSQQKQSNNQENTQSDLATKLEPIVEQISMDSLAITAIKDTIIRDFYSSNQKQTFWRGKKLRTQLVHFLENVAQEGFEVNQPLLDSIKQQENNILDLNTNQLIAYDIFLSKTLLLYLKYLSEGQLNPKKLYRDYDLKKRNIDYVSLLQNFKTDNFETAINKASPNHSIYVKLKQALQLINTFPEETFEPIFLAKKIELNDSLKEVLAIKRRLQFWGDLKNYDSISPIFDEEASLAIQTFQKRHGLNPDGVVGPNTVKALNVSPAHRKKQIIANLERWRWYPRDLGEAYIIINIPDYSLNVVKNNDTLRTHNIIVGKPSRRTPVLTSALSHLVFNPTWTIPPTIKKKDVIPSIKKDSNYLKKKNMTVYDKSGKRITASAWNQENALSYTYVQSPGSFNSLGLVKFMFKNRFMVYLHDTNSKSGFNRETRALSSGCIRVQEPFELAAYILNDTENWNMEKIQNLVKTRKTTQATIKNDIQVHVLYWTAWSDQGKLQFRDDFYKKDDELYKRLRN